MSRPWHFPAASRVGTAVSPIRMRLVFSTLLALALVGCGADSAPSTTDESAAASPAPPTPEVIEVASAEALVDDLDSVDAETVVLNFWATWCGPCRLEFPEFIRYDDEMEGEGVEVRFVSLDMPTDLNLIHAFLDEHDVDEPTYLYTGPGDLTSALNPLVGNTLPVTMVLDADRIVRATHVGLMSYDDLTQAVASVREGGDAAAG